MSKAAQIPPQIGPYLLKKRIGEGSFSVVYLAVHSKTKKNFACKIVTAESLKDQDLFVHFESEIRVLHQMRNPNIVQFIDILRDTNFYYVVLEYCPNGDLLSFIIGKKFLTEIEAKILLKQLLNALRYMHSVRVVHRDLKPENLLLDETDMIKVSDFGFARYAPKDLMVSTSCGSPAYASPECLKGGEYNGVKSDMWSVGVILYAMVTGRLPWTEKNDAKLLEQITKADYKIPKYLSADAQRLIGSLLTVDPAARPTCDDLLSDPWFVGADTIAFDEERPCISLKYLDSFFGKDGSDIVLRQRKKLEMISMKQLPFSKTAKWIQMDPGLPKSHLPSLSGFTSKGIISAAELLKKRKHPVSVRAKQDSKRRFSNAASSEQSKRPPTGARKSRAVLPSKTLGKLPKQ